MSDLLAFNNDIMGLIFKNIDTESHLIVGLTCKEMYKILKAFNQNKKLNGSLRYLTSNLSLFKYANKNRCPLNNRTIKYILNDTNKESLECLKYVHHENRISKWRTCLKYLYDNGCPWQEWVCYNAAENGQLECLKYARENGCPWSTYTCECAARNGHLECLKYAKENGCPWSIWACKYAAQNGHLECVKYCNDNGCPWSERA